MAASRSFRARASSGAPSKRRAQTRRLFADAIAEGQGVKFDLGKMSWIGKAASDPHVVVVPAKSPYRSFADLRRRRGPSRYRRAASKLNVNMILGYDGTDSEMAMRRGEIDASLGSLSSLEPVPLYGDEVAEQIRKALQQPPYVVEKLAAIVNAKAP